VFAVGCYLGEEDSPLAVKLEQQVLMCNGEPERLASAPFEQRLAD